jgi:hypothetical protein
MRKQCVLHNFNNNNKRKKKGKESADRREKNPTTSRSMMAKGINLRKTPRVLQGREKAVHNTES